MVDYPHYSSVEGRVVALCGEGDCRVGLTITVHTDSWIVTRQRTSEVDEIDEM